VAAEEEANLEIAGKSEIVLAVGLLRIPRSAAEKEEPLAKELVAEEEAEEEASGVVRPS